MGGTKAILEEFEPYECILAKHISMVNNVNNCWPKALELLKGLSEKR